MKLQSLHVEHFGLRSELQLNDLSDRLNVVYGPNGSGKTTAIQFVRWMLFGNNDAAVARYLGRQPAPAEGTLSVLAGQQAHRIHRRDDGTRHGQLSVDRSGHVVQESAQLNQLLGGLRQNDFDLHFVVNFDQPSSPDELARGAIQHGFDMMGTAAPVDQIAQVQRDLEELRSKLDELPATTLTRDVLVDHRNELQTKLDALLHAVRDDRSTIQRDYEAICDQIAKIEAELNPARRELDDKESTITTRRQLLEETYRRAEESKITYVDELQTRLDDLETHLEMWRNVLEDMRDRQLRIEDQVRLRENVIPLEDWEGIHASGCLIRPLAVKMEDLERHLQDLDNYRSIYKTRREDFRMGNAHLGTTLESLRQDIQHLCRQLRGFQQSDELHDLNDEVRELRHCEGALTQLVESLERRRQRLIDQISAAERYGLSVVVETPVDPDSTWQSRLADTDVAAAADWRFRAVPQASYEYDVVEPGIDDWLRDLTRQRDSLIRDLDSLEHRYRDLVRRREQIEARRERVLDPPEAATIRREIDSLTEQLRTWEQRHALRQQVRRLEEELTHLSHQDQMSDVIQDASQWLQVMTGGKYTRLGLTEDRRLWVEDDSQRTVQAPQLGRGTRDQLHLALAMALVAAYRQKGISLPLILNDVFVNIDSEHDDLLAEAIQAFADRGHQVVLFTRHRHVLDIFRRWNVRQFELPGHVGSHVSPPNQVPAGTEWSTIRETAQHLTAALTPPDGYPVTVQPEIDDIRFARTPPPRPATAAGPTTPVPPGPPANPPKVTVASVSELTQLDSLQWLTDDVLARFNVMGVQTVRALLDLSPTVAERELRQFGISDTTIRDWQRALALACYVDGVLLRDALVLVASGITDVARLSDFDGHALEEHLQRYLQSAEGRRDFPTRSYDYERQRLTAWVRAARHANRIWSDRRRSSFRGSSFLGDRAVSAEEHEDRSVRRSKVRASQRSHSDTKQPSPATGLPAAPRVARKFRDRKTPPEDGQAARGSESGTLRFFLDSTDPLVDAPSIGAKTASHFETIGISSVAQFLRAHPEKTAKRLGQSRIKAETIRQWQAQASLVCCVPELRGHDAQVLVSCGITDAKQLATIKPETLWGTIQPFLETKDAKRIVRGGKAPDLAEVTEWVSAAQSARSLKAA